MPRHAISSTQTFIGACGLTVVLALLPLRWLGWVNDLAGIVRLPAIPAADLATRARVWLEGGPERSGPRIDDVDFLRAEVDRYRVLSEEWRQLAEEYGRMIAQLQNTRRFGLNVPYTPVIANIVGRNTQSDGTSYLLNVGSHRHNVVANSVVVHEGAHLIGRVSDVNRLQSVMVPIVDRSFTLLRAVVSPTRNNPNLDRAVPVHLENSRNGTFRGDVPHEADVSAGDQVYLSDPSWPRSAQALIIGTIESIEPDESNPLLQRIVVRPVFDAARLSSVTIKVQQTGAPEDGGAAEGELTRAGEGMQP